MNIALLFCIMIAVVAGGFMVLAWAGDMYDRHDMTAWRMTDDVVDQLQADLTARLYARRCEMGARWILCTEYRGLPLWLVEQA